MRFTICGLLGLAQLFAQTQPAPTFEVATFKLAPPPEGDRININLGLFRNGRLTSNNVTLSDVMKFAYELVSDEQLVVPEWNRSVRFDIEALAPAQTPPAQLHLMMQTLLKERLHLAVRREQRTLRYLALVPGRGGPKFPASKPATPFIQGPQVRGSIVHTQMTMNMLVTLLSRFERQTVIDSTGLPGQFEIKLEWAPDTNLPADDPTAPPPDRPSLFSAVQEQLGLRLESKRGPLDVLIVERASRVPESD